MRKTRHVACLQIVPDFTYSATEAAVKIPYEFEPPAINQDVVLLDRGGKKVGEGKILRIDKRKHAYIVTFSAPKSIAMKVRNFRKP